MDHEENREALLRYLRRDPRQPFTGSDYVHPDPEHWTNVRKINTAPSWKARQSQRGSISPSAQHHKVTKRSTPWALYALEGAIVLGLALLWLGRDR
jgi:hypothetical protein